MAKPGKNSPTKTERLQAARESLELAEGQWDAASVAWWEPANPAECVTNAFYSYENAVTAAMIAVGRKRTRKHYEKADIAAELFETQQLKTDVSETLRMLNEVRKDVQYGEPGHDLKAIDLEDLVSELETFIEEVKKLVESIENG